MASITILAELAHEDRERMDLLIELLSCAHLDKEDAAGFLAKKMNLPQEAVYGTQEAVYGTQDTTQPVEPEVPAAPADDPQPQYTADDVRALVQRLVSPATGKRDATRKIVNEYAAKVGDIPADKYAEVMTRLQTLLEG